MQELKKALVEIVAVAERYDVGLGVTISNEDSARYLFRLPSWSIVRASTKGAIPARVSLKEGETVVGAYDIDPDLTAPDAEARIKGSVHSLQSSVDNMRRYADTVDSILQSVMLVLEEHGIGIAYENAVMGDDEVAYTSVPCSKGKPN